MANSARDKPRNEPRTASAQPVLDVFARYEWRWIAALCLIAALRVFFGAAALPFFADTDENAHFDLVHKFSRGVWPAKKEMLHDRETIETWILDGSPEFLNQPGSLGVEGGFPPPVRDWQRSAATETYLQMQRASPGRGRLPNHEVHEPPVYYALAAIWYEFGRAFGLSPASAIYWVRFLNAPLFAALVATAHVFCRSFFGRDIAFAVAALTTFFPNTVFFTVSADVLCPLPVLLTMLFLLRWYESEQFRPGLAAAAGSLAALSVLVKLSNAAVFVVLGVVVFLRYRRGMRVSKVSIETLLVIICAVLPPLIWCVRNRLVLGDWTGTAAKTQALGWSPKPFNQLLDHPLFTIQGLGTFLSVLCNSFYGGDNNWHAEPVRCWLCSGFFMATSAVLPVVAVVVAVRNGTRQPRARLAAIAAALLVIAYLAELSVLSLRWDFGATRFPSRDFPYFATGRLASGCLVPFLALYAYGLASLLRRRLILVVPAVAMTILMMILQQATYLRLTIGSQFNWFHLP